MSERISLTPEYRAVFPATYSQPGRQRTQTYPATHQPPSKLNYHADPIKAAGRVQELLFSSTRGSRPYSIQVYIFAMKNHFLVMMSPKELPFTPFTHTADGLYHVNPLYQKPLFTYSVSTEIYQAIQKESAGLDGIPPLMIFKGTWNQTLFHPNRCFGQVHDLIFGQHTAIQTPEFSLHKVPNSWSGSDTLQGIAYSLGDKVFRVWFHEKNAKALTNAIGVKREEIKELKRLQTFLTDVPTFLHLWHPDLFKKEEESSKVGDWCRVGTLLVSDHPDKLRAPDERVSAQVQKLTTSYRKTKKEVAQNKKKPIERLEKEKDLENVRQELVTALKTFLDESMDWIGQSSLSLTPNFRQGLEGAIRSAEQELDELVKGEALLATPGKEKELSKLSLPTSAYQSTMQIESSTENASERDRLWVYIPTCIKLVDWHLGPLERWSMKEEPVVPIDFFEQAIQFLQKKEGWIRQHGFTSQMDPDRFLRLVRYRTHSLQELHHAFTELRRFFTNAPITEQAAASYPFLKEEAFLWNKFTEEVEKVFAAASPDYTFQFFQETTKLRKEQKSILAGGTLYKRITHGGNVAYEFLKEKQRSALNQENWVHIPVGI